MSLLPSDSDEDSNDVSELTINKSYANSYNRFREKEVFQKLKDKYGESRAKAKLDQDRNEEPDEDSTSSSEDDEAEALDEETEKNFFKTLACLKKKDPSIYDKNVTFFNKAIDTSRKKEKDKGDKPLYLGDLERKVMLERGGEFEDINDPNLEQKSRGKSYVEENKEIQESFKKFMDDDEDDDLLVKKEKTKAEKEKEEDDYKAWLAGQKDQLKDPKTAKELGGLREFWNKKDLDKEEKFLKDYILNKRYLDADDEDSDREDDEKVHDSADGLSEDEKNLEEMEQFEHKFNFRFEEPDPEFIKRYPRTVQDSMRRENNKRKQKRQTVQERKEQEKEQRKQELQQLKAMKKKEILDKLETLKKISGSKDLAFNDEDVEGDFDPEEHDRRMAELFGNYDNVEVENEDERPEISDEDSDLEELEVENWDEWDGTQAEHEPNVEDPDFNMDCDYDENMKKQIQDELIESSRNRKRRRKSKFTEVLEKKKPIFDPKDKTFEQYLDEYYKLDYEDIAGGQKCRFKYRNVEENDFGLSTEEILSAPDRELNAWVSLKKTCQYRPDDDERADVRLFKSRANNVQLKRKLIPTLFEEDPEKELQQEKDKKAKKSKRKRKQADDANDDDEAPEASSNKKVKHDTSAKSETPKKSKKKNKKKGKSKANNESNKKDEVNKAIKMSDDRLSAYGINPNKLKRSVKKKKYANKS